MNNKKKKVVFLGFLISFHLFSYPQVQARSQQKVILHTIDHVKDSKKAKKWAEKQYAAWKKTLSKDEERSLEKLLQPLQDKEENNFPNINHQLKAYGGDLSQKPTDTPVANKRLQDHVDRVSHAINRKEGKLEKPLIVYKNESLEDVLHVEDEYFQNSDQTLNTEDVNQLKATFSAGLHSEFRIYDLFEDPNQDKMVKWKIELPAGTPTGLVTSKKIVIDKDSAFKVNDIKIIAQKGKQVIRIDAKLVPKETVTREIKQLTDQLVHKFNARFNFPQDKKIFEFKLTGSASHFIANKLEGLVTKLADRIDHSILKQIFQYMSNKEAYISLTDQKLYSLPHVYEPDERTLEEVRKMINIAGYFNKVNRTLSVHLPEDMQKKADLGPDTLFHELGHAIDYYGAQLFKLKEEELSGTIRFQSIFAAEGQNLTKYGSVNSAEFFAEAFWLMHSPEEKKTVEEKSPLAYNFILYILKLIKDRGSTLSGSSSEQNNN